MNKIVIWIVGFNCAFLQRNISPCPRQTKVLCYKALVRPLVEYACTVWDPHTQKNISKLEMLQRTLRLQRLSKDKQCQLDASGTPMANSARKASPIQGGNDLQMCQLSCGHPTSLCCTSSYDFTKRTFSKIIVPFARTLAFQRSFFPDAIRMWNSLPQKVVNCTTVDCFRQEVQASQLR